MFIDDSYGKKGHKVTVSVCFKCQKTKIVYIIDKIKLKATGQIINATIPYKICQLCISEEVNRE